MKNLKFILILGFFVNLILISCETTEEPIKNESEFRIEFSDGSEIMEKDILYYDSTTHLLFLKEKLELNQSISAFKVFADTHTIYTGIIWSCALSSLPPKAFFITDCYQYGQYILDIGYYPHQPDLRNDPRLISALKENNLLRSGLTCIIDSLKVNRFGTYSEVVCKITIANNDQINYYIIDPNKMGELDFNCYTGGLGFQNIDTKVYSFFRWSVSNPDYGDLTMNDFSLLPKNTEVSYTFKSSDYHKMENGYYNTTFRFCGLKYNTEQFELDQNNGRIWVGEAVLKYDSLKVN